MTCLKETLTLLPGVNSCFHWQLMTKPPETDVTTRCKRGLTNERQLLYSHSSTTHKHGKTDERNSFVMEGTTAGRKRTQWSQGKQTSERDRKERECESDGWNWCTQTRENFRSSTFQGSPVTLYLTISLSWCQRPTDLVICKLYFERGRRRGINQKERRNVRPRCHFSILPQEKCQVHTHCLVLHAGEYHIQHLREGGFGRGLVDEVLTGQIDVVTRSHGLQNCTFVDLYVLRGHGCEQGLSGTGVKKKNTNVTTEDV